MIGSQRICFTFLLMLNFRSFITKAEEQTYQGSSCDNTAQQSLGSAYQTNLDRILTWMSSDSGTSNGYNITTIGSNNSSVYGLYYCGSDLTGYICQVCISTAAREAHRLCSNRVSAVVWHDYCVIRYSNENFFGKAMTYPTWHILGTKNISNITEIQIGEDFLRSLIRKATNGTNQLYYRDGFNLSATESRYSVVQCSRDLTNEVCRQCLEDILAELPKCCEEKLAWNIWSGSCLIRYDDYMFYLFNTQPPSAPAPNVQDKQGSDNRSKILIITFSVAGPIIVLCFSVYSFWHRKSVRKDVERRKQFDWKLRLSIINGIPRGMFYLHEDSQLRVIHRDLKASNVLLDHDMNPKISDFGLARAFEVGQNQANTKRVMGTYGYMAPEYAMEGLFSVKSDVFSFGVLVLEIICGRKNGRFFLSDGQILLVYAWRIWYEGKCLELMDPILEKSFIGSEVQRCIQIGLLCVQEDARDRPTMSDVVVMLVSDTVAIPKPKHPAFSVGRMASEKGSPYRSSNNLSINDITSSITLPSFGVLVLEIISGRKNGGFYLSDGQNLLVYALRTWYEGKCLELMDSMLEKSFIGSEVERCIQIGLLCVQEDARDRPTMSDVVMLASDTVAIPKPRHPAFSVGRTATEEVPTSRSSKKLSISDITTSITLPR
ncbi:hypothetical protein LR48_Vigan08g029300 [Vigna angularis]|uniref:Cysteine-rich receptor-like protein kinase n=1 Tax=Phaseolus angularis TaxID=3914 RepID=A0A0L9V3E5_PHAAN|nr:hypothetical protein LR48_Vigan08g029300 [Vigna angularis]